MSESPSRSADGASLWQTVRDLLRLKSPNSLRESIEEAIDEHVDEGASADDLDLAERDMLRNLLHLSDRKAGEIAVPRSDIVAFDLGAPFSALVALFRVAGHSRLPVYRDSLDAVEGMIHVKDVYATIAETFDDAVSSAPFAAFDPARLKRDVLFVPPSMPVLDLLTRMRATRTHMAIVVDEYGGTDGLVTIEDIVEEIVGEIEDEHDEDEAALLVALDDGRYEADARLPLDDLDAALGIAFVDDEQADEVDTLGGLAFLLAGRVPETGERLAVPNGWTIEIVESDGRRVSRLRLLPPPPDAGQADPDIRQPSGK
jgi:CBS domain containing-hemolysin-like protein